MQQAAQARAAVERTRARAAAGRTRARAAAGRTRAQAAAEQSGRGRKQQQSRAHEGAGETECTRAQAAAGCTRARAAAGRTRAQAAAEQSARGREQQQGARGRKQQQSRAHEGASSSRAERTRARAAAGRTRAQAAAEQSARGRKQQQSRAHEGASSNRVERTRARVRQSARGRRQEQGARGREQQQGARGRKQQQSRAHEGASSSRAERTRARAAAGRTRAQAAAEQSARGRKQQQSRAHEGASSSRVERTRAATAEAEGEAAERRRNLENGREEGRGRVWDEVREVDRKAEARGGVALADGDEDMSGYGVASAENLRNAKQIANAILNGRLFAGMSRGKRHWAGDDAGESGGEDGGVGERVGGRKERRGEGRGAGGDDEEQEEEWRRSFRERGWRPGFRGLGDWLGEAGGGPAEEEGQVPVEKQRFARVPLVGAPNAGKSALMNRLVGVKISAVSRKTNTMQREVVGIRTTGPTQLVFHDTRGLTVAVPSQPLSATQRQGSLLASSAVLHCNVVALVIDADHQIRRCVSEEGVQGGGWLGSGCKEEGSLLASSAALHCHVVALVIDADRQIRRPDPRVRRMVGVVGAERREGQQRVAVLNKVDLVKDKRLLLPLAQELSAFHSIERVFMVSALQDKGVNLLEEYLFDHAVQAPWEEDPRLRTDQSPEQLAMQIVRELLLHRMHQEVPYAIEHRHVSCSVLKDGSLRIEQLLLVHSNAQRAMLVGKAGQVVRDAVP
ncbi:unnamed protein product [Closterium sp. NIES-65]|nr:unnamed protein product [Closterium sp. NIES-65]